MRVEVSSRIRRESSPGWRLPDPRHRSCRIHPFDLSQTDTAYTIRVELGVIVNSDGQRLKMVWKMVG